MGAPDPLINMYVAGLDLVSVQMGVGAAGAVIGWAPLTEVPQSQSVILYSKRSSNIERMMASVRFQFADVPTRATISGLVSAVLKCADAVGVSILTETELRIIAVEAIVEMETELAQLQSAAGLSAINRSVQNDAAAAGTAVQALHGVICSWLDGLGLFTRGGGKRRWRDLAILHHGFMTIIGPWLADTIYQLSGGSKWIRLGERRTSLQPGNGREYRFGEGASGKADRDA
jgi:hypothetical protein